MTSFGSDDLFGDIAADVPDAQADSSPLGGAHRAVIQALGTPTGTNGVSHTSASKRLLGVTSTRGDKGWKSRLEEPVLLSQVTATKLTDEEMIVSRRVNGAWRAGASDLDPKAIVDFLEERGYRKISDVVIDNAAIGKTPSALVICRIEKFRLITN